MEGNNLNWSRRLYDASGRCTFEQDRGTMEELKRPIYLGELIIGYETISPKKLKSDSKTKQGIFQRKERERISDIDLAPIVMPQRSVTVYDDETGRKRRINLRKMAEIEKGNEPRKSKLQKVPTRIGGESVLDFVEEREKLEELSKFTSSPRKNHTAATATEDVILIEDIPDNGMSTGKPFDNAQVLGTTDGGNNYKRKTVIQKAGSETFTKTDKEDHVAKTNVVTDIPIRRDNPFLMEEIAIINDREKCETQRATDYGSFDDIQIISEHNAIRPSLPALTHQEMTVTDTEEINNDALIAYGDIGETQELDWVSPKNFCNICGNGLESRNDATTYLEIAENSTKYFICLTCNRKVSFTELTRHEASCFLSQEEFYYHGCEIDFSSDNKQEDKFRMVACLNCVNNAYKT